MESIPPKPRAYHLAFDERDLLKKFKLSLKPDMQLKRSAGCDRQEVSGDLLYVVYWMANAHGFDMEPITDEIHRSNMSKMWTDEEIARPEIGAALQVLCSLPVESGPRRHVVMRISDGKVIKSPSYSKPQL